MMTGGRADGRTGGRVRRRCSCPAASAAGCRSPSCCLGRERRSWSLDDLIRETGCGGQCGLCRPYLRRMLATGETEFFELLPAESGF